MNKLLAIAIDEYNDPVLENLKNCGRDINRLIDILSKKYELDSIELYAKPEQTTLSFLYQELYNECLNSLEGDNLLILFAGHGEFNALLGASYWLCSDSKRSDVTSWFNMETLVRIFNASPAKHIALISDSCFSGAIFELNRGGGLSALDDKASRQALTSGGIEPVSDGDDHSPFNDALVKVLTENTSELLSFSQLSEKTIFEFNPYRTQTPASGSLLHSGDKGGTYFFRLKAGQDSDLVRSIQLSLDTRSDIRIDTLFEIPFFIKNQSFDNGFINAFVHQLGYSIVNDVRLLIADIDKYLVSKGNEAGLYLHVSYSVKTLNEKFLSLVIGRSDYLGGPHPNYRSYSLNFAFGPERKISLYDIVDYEGYKNLEEFLLQMVEEFGEEDCKELLRKYSTYEYLHELDFSFDEQFFTVDYTNFLPHAVTACAAVDIPVARVGFKI